MFFINGVGWNIVFVNENDEVLMRSDGSFSVGVTDRTTKTIYISDRICGDFLLKVLTHELCHAYCMSFGIFMPVEVEEVVADFIATYGRDILKTADEIFAVISKVKFC